MIKKLVLAAAFMATMASHAFALSLQEIADRSAGAIVHLKGLTADGNLLSATGFFITSDGVLITNRHVVKDIIEDHSLAAFDIWGQSLGVAKLKAVIKDSCSVDLAVMKIAVKEPVVYLRPHKWGSAVAGDDVVIWGFPNDEGTISKGSVGGFVDVDGNSVIELRAYTAPGSSGSPVLDADGKVLGVVLGTITGPNVRGDRVTVHSAEPIELAAGMVSAVLGFEWVK